MKTWEENRKEAEARAEELIRQGQKRAEQALKRARQGKGWENSQQGN